jgi:hypothetical protein
LDDIRTLMEEVDMRITETRKDTYEFKRDIIIGAENARTGVLALISTMFQRLHGCVTLEWTIYAHIRL